MISKNKAILLTILLLLAGFLLLACHNNNINEDTDETIPSVAPIGTTVNVIKII